MNPLTRNVPPEQPVKVLQFGEGNFLRCFVDWMIERLNICTQFNGSVQIVQPLPEGMGEVIEAQKGLYTVVLRGMEDHKIVETMETIHCVRGCFNPATQWEAVVESFCLPELRFIFSNTTEAGIEYKEGVDTFPAKLAKLLAERSKRKLPGLVFLPCELIEHNGAMLKKCILQYVKDEAVAEYVNTKCIFCNTLVDRIVSGYPKEEAQYFAEKLGYDDKLLVCGEPFHFFVIEGPETLAEELPFAKAGLNVLFTKDLTPYRTRKVRFLNGAHTATVLAAHMAGYTYVDEMVRDSRFKAYLRGILLDEIAPTIDLPEAEKRAYAAAVLERFANPYAHHRLLSIALNSVSKWKVRVLPTILDYQSRFGKLPEKLTFSLASLIDFYRTCPIQDSPEVKAFFATSPTVVEILANEELWGMDLNKIKGFTPLVEIGVMNL